MIAETPRLDQATIELLREQDALLQRARTLFALLDWSQVDQQRHCPGPHPHPESAYLKAFLLNIVHGLPYMTHLRTFLCDHPLLVLELGFRPVPDASQLSGFDVQRTVPSNRWFREKLRRLDPTVLTLLLEQTVHALQDELPGLGEVVAFDVKHIYAWVRENNPRESIRDRYCKERQPKGDPDCRVGVKKSTNKELPGGSKKEVKEYRLSLWLRCGGSHHARLRRCRAGRVHPTQRVRATSATICPCIVTRPLRWANSRCIPPLMLLTMPGTPRRRWRMAPASPPFPSTRMGRRRDRATLMGRPCAPKACAYTRPISFAIPTLSLSVAFPSADGRDL